MSTVTKLSVKFKGGNARDGINIVIASQAGNLEYHLKGEYGGRELQILRGEQEEPEARVFQVDRSRWSSKYKLVDDTDELAVYTEHSSLFNHRWTVSGNCEWIAKKERGRLTIENVARLKTPMVGVGVSEIELVDFKDELTILGLVGSLFLRDLSRASINTDLNLMGPPAVGGLGL